MSREIPFGAVEIKNNVTRTEVAEILKAAGGGRVGEQVLITRLYVSLAFLLATRIPSFLTTATEEQRKDLVQEIVLEMSRGASEVISNKVLLEVEIKDVA